jgi:hypothetical protein
MVLDMLDAQPFDPPNLISWIIPNLSFLRIDGVLRSGRVEREKQQSSQPNQQEDQVRNNPPKRMYLMEDALAGLHGLKAQVAFLVLGGKTAASYYMGASVPEGTESVAAANDNGTFSYDTVKSVLHSVYNGVDVYKEAFSAESMKALIAARDNHIGVVTGIPGLKSTGDDTIQSAQIERVANGLQGHDFGFLVLAVPIPKSIVNKEEFDVVDLIQRAQENEDPEKKRRIKYYLELQESYLNHLKLGTALGMWQVGAYFFAADRSVFARLQSLLQGTYVDDMSQPTPLRTHEIEGLKPHLEQFGLLRNNRGGDAAQAQSLLNYKFLSPLNSRMLSAYIHVPESETPMDRSTPG